MKTKKAIALVLVLLALMVSVTLPPQKTVAAGSPGIVTDTSKISEGNTVWFGNIQVMLQGVLPIQWRVLGNGNDSGGSSRLLLSDKLLETAVFAPLSNAWQGSQAQIWCGNFYTNSFSATEKNALVETSRDDDAYTAQSGTNFAASDGILNNEFVFYLSAEEAETYFSNDESRKAKSLEGVSYNWWLRSPEAGNNNYAGIVSSIGNVRSKETHNLSTYTRPAFNLNLSSVLFTSPAEGGKVSGPIGKDALTVVPNTETTEWKLTLLDTSRAFSASWF